MRIKVLFPSSQLHNFPLLKQILMLVVDYLMPKVRVLACIMMRSVVYLIKAVVSNTNLNAAGFFRV
jgi:hypothetical protein